MKTFSLICLLLLLANCQPPAKDNSGEFLALFLLTIPNPNCSQNTALMRVASVTGEGFTWETGYALGNNGKGDAYVLQKSGTAILWCLFYDQTPIETSGTTFAYLASEIFVGFSVQEPGSGFRPTTGALQSTFQRGSGQPVAFLSRLNPKTGGILNSTFLKASDSNGIATSFTINSLQLLGDRILVSAKSGFDAGTAEDSLDRGKVCGEGRSRQIELNLELTETVSINCL